MKTILAVAALLVCLTVQLFGAGAAVPYQQLYTNHFDNSVFPLVKIRFNTTQFDYTNPTNGITIPDSAVIGLQYWTNVSGKLFPITGGTNRFFIGGASTSTGTGTNYFGDDGAFHAFTFTSDTNSLWAEIGGVYFPNQVETTILFTNAVVSQALAVDGAFVEQGFSGVTANAGTNNLNPFRVGTFIVNSTTNDPAACIIDLSAGSGTGQMLAIEKGSSGSFTLKNAGLRWDDPSASNILRYVDWVPTYAGETILLHQNQQGNWVEWGRSPPAPGNTNTVEGLWISDNGLYHPAQLQTSMHVTNLNAHGQITLTDRPYNFPADYANSSVLFDYTASGNLIWLGGSTNPLPGLWFTNVYTTNINGIAVSNIISFSGLWTNRSGIVGLIDQTLPVGLTNYLSLGTNGGGTRIYQKPSAYSLQIESFDPTKSSEIRFANTNQTNAVTIGMNNFGQSEMFTTGNKLTFGVGLKNWDFTTTDFFPPAFATFGSTNFPIGTLWLGTGPNAYYQDNGTTLTRNGVPIGGAGGADSWSTNGSYLQPTDLTRGVFITNNMVFGPGTTNVLFSSGGRLVYTNSGAGLTGLELRQGGGHVGLLSVGNSGQVTITSEAGGPVTLQDAAGNGVSLFSSIFSPLTSNSESLGNTTSIWESLYAGSTNKWKFLGLTGTNLNVNVNGTNYVVSGVGGGVVDYASVTNALALTGSTSTYLRSDGTQATPPGGSGLVFSSGTGSPEGAVTGSPGDMYYDTNTDFHYQKITGSATTTGWGVF